MLVRGSDALRLDFRKMKFAPRKAEQTNLMRMKKVTLNELRIENFKCFRDFDILLKGKKTADIRGRNGSGKTSVLDAYLWLLTGADSNGNAGFKIQPLDKSGAIIPKLTTSVTGIFDVDGAEYKICRTLKQKWVKPSGKDTEILKGNEGGYFVNDVPVAEKEFSKRISEIFAPQDKLRLLANPKMFFELPTKEMRSMLIDMAGEMPNLLTPEAYPTLYIAMQTMNSVDDVKTRCAYAIRQIEDRLKVIPDLINENDRNMPSADFEALRKEKDELERRVAEIDGTLQRRASAGNGKYKAVLELKKKITDKTSELAEIKAGVESDRNKLLNQCEGIISKEKSRLDALEYDAKKVGDKVAAIESEIAEKSAELKKIGNEWMETNKEVFNAEIAKVCPTCGRPFSEADLLNKKNDLVRNFNAGKVERLKKLNEKGCNLKAEIEALRKESEDAQVAFVKDKSDIEAAKRNLEALEAKKQKVPSVDFVLLGNLEYSNVTKEIQALSVELAEKQKNEEKDADDAALESEKATANARLKDVISALGAEQMIKKVNDRRKELEDEAEKKAAEMAEQQKLLSEIRDYSKAKITAVESKIDSLFDTVSWKMYEKNITNDGEREICECLVNGVPYSTNVNTAARINAGIDVGNALSKWVKVSMPMWIDNKESCTNLIATDSQVITLTVDDSHDSLIIA